MTRKLIVQTPHTHNGQVLNKSHSIHKAKLREINEPLCKMNVITEILTQEKARGWAPAEKNMTFNTCYLCWITGRSEEKTLLLQSEGVNFMMHLNFICLATRSLVILVFYGVQQQTIDKPRANAQFQSKQLFIHVCISYLALHFYF